MFSNDQLTRTDPADYKALKDSKTILIEKHEYDALGDGLVVIEFTPGLSTGHQSLFLKLRKTGPVVLIGDLYHHPDERSLNRLPINEFDTKQTTESRAAMEVFLKNTGAPTLDPARHHRQRQAEEGAGFLRIDSQ
jgi:glyoxylase-like metal-dependent hydrolase (beta-lactamase superfamily II)